MTHIELTESGLHNRHIKFSVEGKVLHGVVVDDIYHQTGKSKRTDYTFIPTGNLMAWNKAQSLNDKIKNVLVIECN